MRKNFAAASLSARIGTTLDIREAKGGGLHDTIVRRAAACDAQATAEYAVILACVAAVAIVGYQLLGPTVLGLFEAAIHSF